MPPKKLVSAPPTSNQEPTLSVRIGSPAIGGYSLFPKLWYNIFNNINVINKPFFHFITLRR